MTCYIEIVPVVTSWMMACEGHVTSCDFSSSWVCPAVDEERQLWDTSLEAADCKVPSNTAGMIHCAPTWCYSQDEYDQAFYLTLLLPCIISTQRSRSNKRGRLENALQLSHLCSVLYHHDHTSRFVDCITKFRVACLMHVCSWCTHRVLYKLLLPY